MRENEKYYVMGKVYRTKVDTFLIKEYDPTGQFRCIETGMHCNTPKNKVSRGEPLEICEHCPGQCKWKGVTTGKTFTRCCLNSQKGMLWKEIPHAPLTPAEREGELAEQSAKTTVQRILSEAKERGDV